MTLNRGNDNESFVSINLESILLRVLNEVILLSLNKGQWRKKQEVVGWFDVHTITTKTINAVLKIVIEFIFT